MKLADTCSFGVSCTVKNRGRSPKLIQRVQARTAEDAVDAWAGFANTSGAVGRAPEHRSSQPHRQSISLPLYPPIGPRSSFLSFSTISFSSFCLFRRPVPALSQRHPVTMSTATLLTRSSGRLCLRASANLRGGYSIARAQNVVA